MIYAIYQKKIDISEDSVDIEIEKIIKNQKPVKEFELSEIEINFNQETSMKDKIKELSDKINTMGFENVALNFSSSTTASKRVTWVG